MKPCLHCASVRVEIAPQPSQNTQFPKQNEERTNPPRTGQAALAQPQTEARYWGWRGTRSRSSGSGRGSNCSSRRRRVLVVAAAAAAAGAVVAVVVVVMIK